MGYLPSLGSKAAHLASDITAVLLNPVSADSSGSRPPSEEDLTTIDPEKEETEEKSEVPDGPDTSSFTAFLISLLSSSNSSSHLQTSASVESSGRISLFTGGRRTLDKAINKAAKISGLRHSSETKVEHRAAYEPELSGNDSRPVRVTKDDNTYFDLPTMSEKSMLLSDNIRAALYFSLPALVKGTNWLLLYSTWRHGISLSTLYRRSALCPGYSLLPFLLRRKEGIHPNQAMKAPLDLEISFNIAKALTNKVGNSTFASLIQKIGNLLLEVVGDRRGAVFGGLVEAPLQPTDRRKYQGTSSSFVFTDLSGTPVIFRATGRNRYFTLCSSDFLALGGGGRFALYLDGDLSNGSSASSDTFGNSCLAHSEEFEVKEIELWGFVYASKYDEMMELCRTEKPGVLRW